MTHTTSAIGVVLVVLGLAVLGYRGVQYTTRDTVLDIGPIHATADRTHWFALPPVAGVTAVAAGLAVLGLGMRRAR